MSIGDGFTPEELEARAQTTDRILEEVRAALRKGPVHLFLSYFHNSHFDPGGFDELRRLGIPSVNFYCNGMYQFHLVSQIARKADFAWHTERDARQFYLDIGARPVRVQLGADPARYRPIDTAIRKAKACFVGQRYADRDRWMATLAKAGVPLDIYGSGWEPAYAMGGENSEDSYLGRKLYRPGSLPSYGRAICETLARKGLISGAACIVRQWNYRRTTRKLAPLFAGNVRGAIPFDKLAVATVFSGYEICLNFSNVWLDGRPGSRLISHVRLRDFEGPMCRTCYLTGHTDEITEFYDIGKEIDTYRTPQELVDKITFYLTHPNAAESLREAGYRRALAEHTWHHRFEELFRLIGLRETVLCR